MMIPFINPWIFYDPEDIPEIDPHSSPEFNKMKHGKIIKNGLKVVCILATLAILLMPIVFTIKWWYLIIYSFLICIIIGSICAIIDPPFGAEAKDDLKKGFSTIPIIYILILPIIIGLGTIIAGIFKNIFGPIINWVTVSGIIICILSIIGYKIADKLQEKRRKSRF